MSKDPRERVPKYDISKVDFKWVKEQTKTKELMKAY